MTELEIRELRRQCMEANLRTAKKIEKNRKKLERQQTIAFLLMFCLTTIYTK